MGDGGAGLPWWVSMLGAVAIVELARRYKSARYILFTLFGIGFVIALIDLLLYYLS